MENSYGIGVRNRYELFYDDDVDPLDLIKQTEKIKDKSSEKENKAKGTPTAPTKKAPEKTSTKKGDKISKTESTTTKITDKTSQPTTQTKGPRSNDGRVKFSDREERNNRRNRSEGGEFREAPPPRFDGEGRGGMGRGRGRGMGRGRGRGRGGFGGADSRGKREYDRQSGMATTGVKSIDKRDGSGSYNWGSDRDQIDEQLNNSAPAANSDLDTSAENVEKPPEETGTTTEGEEAPKEEEAAKEMTLDEWKAMQGSRNKPTFNIRQAGEGENQAQWKKTYILKKKEEESDEEEEEEEEEEVHHGRRRVILDIDFQFSDSPARGRGRGRGRGGPGRGRGMDRGGRGGGGDRMGGGRGERGERRGGAGSRGGRGASRQEAPKMDDERDFPSLG